MPASSIPGVGYDTTTVIFTPVSTVTATSIVGEPFASPIYSSVSGVSYTTTTLVATAPITSTSVLTVTST